MPNTCPNTLKWLTIEVAKQNTPTHQKSRELSEETIVLFLYFLNKKKLNFLSVYYIYPKYLHR